MKRRTFLQSSFALAAAASLPGRRGLSALYRVAPQDPPDVPAVTGDGHSITLAGADIADLMARMRGHVLLADDEAYQRARHVLNPSFDKYPALIAQPTGSADVQAVVDFAKSYDALVAVKCGGHSMSGKSTCDGGVMIDLSHYRSVRVDPHGRRAWVTGGSLLGALDHESMAHGLVAPMGTVSHTGVGGLVLGGGFGRLARRFGLAIDNLMAVDIVTADGKLRRADAYENADLFWGVRGGGGNFGVVTNFEFRLHPMQREVVGGSIMFPIARARDALTLYSEYGSEARDDLYMDYVMFQPPGSPDAMCGFSICFSGPHDEAETALAPLYQIGSPVVDDVQAMDYVALQQSGDVDDPRAFGSYMKGGFVPELSADLTVAITEGFESQPGRGTALFFQHAGGEIRRVPADATAFPTRRAFGNMMTSVNWPWGSDPASHIEWTRRYWSTLEGYTGGFYTNDADPELPQSAVNDNYGVNYGRLVELKNIYDPTNLFRLNANVIPSV